MNRLMDTGLALGREADVCQVCNFDYKWLIRYPSLLIWADKILLTDYIFTAIKNELWPKPKELAQCFKLIFEFAYAENLIEVIDPTPVVKNAIYEQINKDIDLFKLHYPHKIETRKLGL